METKISPIDELMDASSALYFMYESLDRNEEYGSASTAKMIADKVRAVANFMDNNGWETCNWEELIASHNAKKAKRAARESAKSEVVLQGKE